MKSAKLQRVQNAALILLVLAGLINSLDRSTLAIANSSITAEMGLSASEMGLLLSAFSLPYAFAQLPMGVLLDRLGARIALGLGILVWSLAQLGGGFVRGLNQLFVARVVLGIGEAPQFPAAAKVVSEWFAVKERGRPTGIIVASTTIASGPGSAVAHRDDAGLWWLARDVHRHGRHRHCGGRRLVCDLPRPQLGQPRSRRDPDTSKPATSNPTRPPSRRPNGGACSSSEPSGP